MGPLCMDFEADAHAYGILDLLVLTKPDIQTNAICKSDARLASSPELRDTVQDTARR